jgi:hypothetical protein
MKLVRKKAPEGLSQYSLESAVAECRRHGKINAGAVDTCIGLAAFAESHWRLCHAREAQAIELSMVMNDDLIRRLQPVVEATRKNIFGPCNPPFSSKETMAAWIEKTAREPCPLSTEEKASLYQLQRDIRGKLLEWRARTGLDWRGGGARRFLFYERGEQGGVTALPLPDPNPWEEHPAVRSPLAELQRAADDMADITGFSPASLVTYILTGIRPALCPLTSIVSQTCHEYTGILRRQVTLEFSTGDVSFEELRLVYGKYRKHFSTTRKKRLLPPDEEFLALVQQHGHPPKGKGSGAMAYWERVRQVWNQKRGKEVWKSPGVARTKYDRITKRQKELLGY